MPELTTEVALNILIGWLQDNISCNTGIIFDNDEDKTDSAVLLPGLSRRETMFVISAIFSFCNRPEPVSHRTILTTHL